MVNRRKAILETPKRRRRRRRRQMWIAVIIAVLVLIAISLIIGFFRLPYFRVSKVEVVGASEANASVIKTDAEAVIAGNYALVIPRDNYFFYPEEEVEERVKRALGDVSEVKVNKGFFDKVTIEVRERTAKALYCADSCYYMDDAGLVYKEGGEGSSGSMVVFRDAAHAESSASDVSLATFASSDAATSSALSMTSASTSSVSAEEKKADIGSDAPLLNTYPLETETFKGLESFASKIPSLNLHLIDVQIGKNGETVVRTQEGDILVSLKRPFDEQFSLLATALSQGVFNAGNGVVKNFDYIDLRFGNKVFYK